jgi:pimeloyl-ACP methyl ester carboxylesterase
MIQDHPTSEHPAWRLIGQEVLGLAATAALYPFGLRPSRRRTARSAEQRSVVLIHGYMANRSTLFPVEAWLRMRGVKQVLSFDYASSRGVEAGARALREYLRRHVRGGRVDLVCHSLGGLVARVYLQELGGARRVDRCVTLGTPHRGTYNAYWLTSRVGGELRPDSALLRRLEASRANAAGVRFLSLVAGSDNLVIPRVFAGHERELHFADVGHLSMLFSPRVLATVADFLCAEPEPVAEVPAAAGSQRYSTSGSLSGAGLTPNATARNPRFS